MGDALVVIPTYNERENVALVLPRVLAADPRLEVLVVDDSSPDGTAEIVESFASQEDRVHLLRRPGKEGLGAAYLAGFDWALERDYGLVLEMDADLSHDPQHLPEFLALAETHDLIVGSRYMRGVTVVNWPMARLVLSWLANWYARVVTGIPLHDLTSGFKC